MLTKIVTCKCKSAYQDRVNGNKRRVANVTVAAQHHGKARCTVCGALH